MTNNNSITRLGNPNLPFDYICNILLYLKESRNARFLTYKGLTNSRYLTEQQLDYEYKSWHVKNLMSPYSFYLIHYDIDANVQVFHDLIRFHVHNKIPASCTIFHQRIFDSHLKSTGEIKYDESYIIDFSLLQSFIDIGGCVGYHCNAAERSLFHNNEALKTIRTDLAALTQAIDISYFTMHGGPVGSNGLSNSKLLGVDPILQEYNISWVHNGRSLSFDFLWDDGSAGRPSYSFSIGDPLLSLSLMSRGSRARLLFHPQYYKSTHSSDTSHIHQSQYKWFQDLSKVPSHEDCPAPPLTKRLPVLQRLRHTQKSELISRSNIKSLAKYIYLSSKKSLSKLRLFTQRETFLSRPSTVDTTSYPAYIESQVNHYKPQHISREAVSKLTTDSKAVFVHGMSRSGTTLLCSVLNSHPTLSFGYELYPNLLQKSPALFYDCDELLFYLSNKPEGDVFNWLHSIGLEKVSRFVACVGHSGLSLTDLQDVLALCASSKLRLVDETAVLKLMLRISSVKAWREGKTGWGSKATGNIQLYKNLFSSSSYIYICRDPRSIFYSQLHNGSFNPDLEKLYNTWHSKYNHYRDMEQKGLCLVVKYEELVLNKEKSIRRICNFAHLDFSPSLCSHHKSDNTLLLNPRGQLSADRVSKPIDISSLHAWKSLDRETLSRFETISSGSIDEYWDDL